MKNHGTDWIHLGQISSLKKTQNQLLWSGKRHWKRTLLLRWLQKITTNLNSFQGSVNLQISFVRYHRQRGESHLLAKWKTCFFLMKIRQSYALKVLFKTYWACCISWQKIWTLFWELATSDVFTLIKLLNESYVPKAVLKPSFGINLILKCLWILHKKFKISSIYKDLKCVAVHHCHHRCWQRRRRRINGAPTCGF